MIPLPQPPRVLQKSKSQAVFEVEGLYPGYGATIGNALRRVLLTSLEGAAVTEVKIKGVAHEFSTIKGVLEDVIMILLNVKNLRFKIRDGETHKAELLVKREGEITGKDFKLPPQLELANPEIRLATITDGKTEFNMEIMVEKGIGYEPKDQRKSKLGSHSKPEIGAIDMDAIFTPIKNVNFQVENMRVGDRTDFDKLIMSIETDGTITPEEAFYQACEVLIKHFSLIFSNKPEESPKKIKPENIAEEPEKINVEDLKLSARTLNSLVNGKIKTVGGILKKSEKALSEMEGMGEKAISEIKKKLKKLGLELK